jgi:hypothetical protein
MALSILILNLFVFFCTHASRPFPLSRKSAWTAMEKESGKKSHPPQSMVFRTA